MLAAQIAVLGHLAGGGSAPDLTLLIAMSVLLLVTLRGLGSRRRRFRDVLAAMVGTQVVFHLILTLAGARHQSPTPHDDHPIRMFAFHALAALLSAGLLAYGERLLFLLHGWFSRLAPQLTPLTPAPAGDAWVAVIDRTGTVLRERLIGRSRWRRGPPAELIPAR